MPDALERLASVSASDFSQAKNAGMEGAPSGVDSLASLVASHAQGAASPTGPPGTVQAHLVPHPIPGIPRVGPAGGGKDQVYVVETTAAGNVGNVGDTGFGGGGTKYLKGTIPHAFDAKGLWWGEPGGMQGNVPYGTPVQITANGKSVIAYKADVGSGGGGAQIDLYPGTWKALGLTPQALGQGFGKGHVKVRVLTNQQAKALGG